MGQMLGYFKDDTVVVLDAFALPGEGTETRVTALNEAYEYLVNYKLHLEQVVCVCVMSCPSCSLFPSSLFLFIPLLLSVPRSLSRRQESVEMVFKVY